MLIGRTITGLNGSKQAKVISTDWGLTWSDEIEYVEGLKGVVCDIGLIRYADDPNMILVSQPSGASIRENLVMRVSTDEGATWNSSKLLQEGRATYSDLALLPDKTVVCLFGKGGGSTSPVSVVLLRFNRQWLLAD